MCLLLLYLNAISEMILEAKGTARESDISYGQNKWIEDLDLPDRRTRELKMVNMAGTMPSLIIRALKL